MDPAAFSIMGMDIMWYGIIISMGMVSGILIARYACRFKNINYDKFVSAVIIALPAGIAGARLYYVLFNLSYYIGHTDEIFNIRQGGLAIHGGVILGMLAAFIYIKLNKLDFMLFADAAAPSIIFAQAVGRWGNFFNQEAYGGVVSYEFIKKFPEFIQKGMYIEGSFHHPTFLYESLWNFTAFIVLMILTRFSKRKGIVFFTYIGLYSTGRFFIEGMRTDSLMLGPFRIAQIVSLIGITAWIVFIVVYYLKRNRKINQTV